MEILKYLSCGLGAMILLAVVTRIITTVASRTFFEVMFKALKEKL